MAHDPHPPAHPHAATVDLLPAGASDSHGAGHHGHTIVPMRLLVSVLAILMFFTLLTVLAANGEELFSRMFHVHIPAWVNVVVALSIGAVKSIIVALYFMQLRYDTPVNALVGVFTIMVLTFFLGFTMLDLGSRGAIDEFKGFQQVPGGFGEINRTAVVEDADGTKKIVSEAVPTNTSIAQWARIKADLEIDQALADGKPIKSHAFQLRLAIRHQALAARAVRTPEENAQLKQMHAYIEANHHDFEHIHHELAAHAWHGGEGWAGYVPGPRAANSSNVSRTRTGLTPGLFDDAPHAPADPHRHPAAPHAH